MRLHVFSTAPKHGVLHPKAALLAAALTCHPPGTPKATPSPWFWGTMSSLGRFQPNSAFPPVQVLAAACGVLNSLSLARALLAGGDPRGRKSPKKQQFGQNHPMLPSGPPGNGTEHGFRAAGTHRAAPVLPQHPGAAFWARTPRSAHFLLPALPHGVAGRRAPRVRDIWGSAPVPAPRWVPRSGMRPAPPCLSFPSAGGESGWPGGGRGGGFLGCPG